MRGYLEYVAGEIDNVERNWPAAERRYRAALDVAAATGATFLEAIASVGLVSAYAAAGKTADALAGYRDLLDYWEQTGAWTQQWTTLRNVADLLERLGDAPNAALLRDAADRAPEAATIGVRDRDRAVAHVPERPREEVLARARAAIERELRRAART